MLGVPGAGCSGCWVFRVFRVLGFQAAGVFRGFRVLGVPGVQVV